MKFSGKRDRHVRDVTGITDRTAIRPPGSALRTEIQPSLRVIESIDESQALVEVLLCGRDSSGDGFVVGTEVGVEGDRFRKAFRRRGRHRRLCARAGSGTGEQNSRGEPDDVVVGPHGVPPSSLGRRPIVTTIDPLVLRPELKPPQIAILLYRLHGRSETFDIDTVDGSTDD